VHRAVVDASVLVDFLLRRRDARLTLDLVEDPEVELHMPQLCDIEVASGIRRALHRGMLKTVAAARSAHEDLRDLPLERYEHGPLLDRIVDLYDNFTTYDAAYVALAEALNVPLLTADARLATATRAHTGVDVIKVTT
jgi:predicted nucleic acid-binding protein